MSRLIVYERHPFFAPALSRRCPLALHEVRSLTQARQAVFKHPHSLVCVAASHTDLLDTLAFGRWAKHVGSTPLVGLVPVEGRRWQNFLHESGYDLIIHSHLDLGRFERLANRWQAQIPAVTEDGPSNSLRSFAWNRTPWKRYDSAGGTQTEKGNNESE